MQKQDARANKAKGAPLLIPPHKRQDAANGTSERLNEERKRPRHFYMPVQKWKQWEDQPSDFKTLGVHKRKMVGQGRGKCDGDADRTHSLHSGPAGKRGKCRGTSGKAQVTPGARLEDFGIE